MLKLVRKEEGYIVKDFFKSFKQNFKQATIIWLIMLVFIFVVVGAYLIINYSGIEFPQNMAYGLTGVAMLLFVVSTYIFPVLSHFDNTIKNTIKNAFIMSLLQFPKTILMIIMWVVPVVLAVLIPQIFPICFLFGFSLPAFVSALLYNKFFQKLEDRVLAESEPAEEEVIAEEEDERIFKDELDEALVESQIEQK